MNYRNKAVTVIELLRKLECSTRVSRSSILQDLSTVIIEATRHEVDRLLHFSLQVTDDEITSKVFNLLAVLASRDLNHRVYLAKNNGLYCKAFSILSNGLLIKTIPVLKCIIFLTHDSGEDYHDVAVYARNMVRHSGILRVLVQHFDHSMLGDMLEPLCLCLAGSCHSLPLSQALASQLIPRIVLIVDKRPHKSLLILLESLLHKNDKNKELFIGKGGVKIFTRDLLQSVEGLELLCTALEDNQPLKQQALQLHLHDEINQLLNGNFVDNQVKRWCFIAFQLMEKQFVPENNFPNYLMQSREVNNNENSDSTFETICPIIKKKPKPLQMNSNQNEINHLVPNIFEERPKRNQVESFYHQDKYSFGSCGNVTSAGIRDNKLKRSNNTLDKGNMSKKNCVSNGKSCYGNSYLEKVSVNTATSNLHNNICGNGNRLESFTDQSVQTSFEFSSVHGNEYNGVRKSAHNGVAITLDKGYRKNASSHKSNKPKLSNSFKPRITSTPIKTLISSTDSQNFNITKHSNYNGSRKQRNGGISNDSVMREVAQRQSDTLKVYSNSIRKKGTKLSATTDNGDSKPVNENGKPQNKSFFEKLSGLWKNITRAIVLSDDEDAFQKNPSFFSRNTSKNTQRKLNKSNYSTQQASKVKDLLLSQNISTNSALHDCLTCNDTAMLQKKMASNKDLRDTVNKLKLGVRYYGCNFSKIAKFFWRNDAQINAEVLDLLYRKVIMRE